jgi:hypothetical protein
LLRRFSERFEVVRMAYSYHFLGAALDAAFFASFKAPFIGSRVESMWRGQENGVYRRESAEQSRPSLLSRFIQLANHAAYLESKLLRNVPFAAKGVHFNLRKAGPAIREAALSVDPSARQIDKRDASFRGGRA